MPFQPFDPDADLRIYFTTMPHWRQTGCTYFVTYRLADSIPARVLEQLEQEKCEWLAVHEPSVTTTRKWKEAFLRLGNREQQDFLKCFNRKLHHCLDEGIGSCALRDPRCSATVIGGWEHFDSERYELDDLVVMPNHVHLLVTPRPGHELEDILHSRKRQSSREINLITGRNGALWQKHSFDHIVRNETALEKFRQYIEDNPGKANLREGEYRYRRAPRQA